MRKVFFVFIVFAMTACYTTFQPKLGMPLEDFRSMGARSFNGYPDLVSAGGRQSVYRLRGDPRTIYIFENDKLIGIEQAEAAQIRYQVETIRK
jgi:hypothetical protein